MTKIKFLSSKSFPSGEGGDVSIDTNQSIKMAKLKVLWQESGRRGVCRRRGGMGSSQGKLPGGGVTWAKSLKDDEGEMGEISKGRRVLQAEGGAQIDNWRG